MPFYQLTPNEIFAFAQAGEICTGVQIGEININDDNNNPENLREVIVYSSLIAFDYSEDSERDLHRFLDARWLKRGLTMEERTQHFQKWLTSQPKRPVGKTISVSNKNARSLRPIPSTATMPKPSIPTYGHLPFAARTHGDDIFYHFEVFPPPSKRVVRNSSGRWEIIAGTFANPPSELPMMASGFAVTARNALPGLLPACFRYEIQPAPRAFIRVGAGVPLYGHAGGGVEIEFFSTTANRCEVADPVFVNPL